MKTSVPKKILVSFSLSELKLTLKLLKLFAFFVLFLACGKNDANAWTLTTNVGSSVVTTQTSYPVQITVSGTQSIEILTVAYSGGIETLLDDRTISLL